MTPAELAPSDLLTIAGASVAAFVVAQFAKMLFTLSRVAVRVIAMSTGLIIVPGAYLALNPGIDPLGAFLAILVGMQSGMAANAMFDTASSGIAYQVTDPRLRERGGPETSLDP